MASAILFDSGNDNINSPHSSDDSDAVNTDSARVYFGPLQSPEKKFAPPPGSARLRTPLRRSTRLSSAAVASSILSDKHSDGEEDAQSEPNAGLPYQPKESSSANDAIVLGDSTIISQPVVVPTPPSRSEGQTSERKVEEADSGLQDRPSCPSREDPSVINNAQADDPLIAINTKGLQSHDVGEPAWRSARPSSATPVSSSFPEEDSEDDDETEHGPDGLPAGTSDRSREGTPIQDILPPDEPSSALASKVLRAHDNPSPPPSPAPEERSEVFSSSMQSDHGFLVDSYDSSVRTNDRRFKHVATPSSASQTHSTARKQRASNSPRQPSSPEANASEPLIIFDSFSTPSASPRIRTLRPPTVVEPVSPSIRNTTITTVDDLLSLSPVSSPSGVDPSVDSDKHDASNPLRISGDDPSPSADEEEQVRQVLNGQAEALSSQHLSVPQDVIPSYEVAAEPEPHTPIRRSTRPRRSRSPFLPKIMSEAAASSAPGPSRQSETRGTNHSLAAPVGLRIKKKARNRGATPNRENSAEVHDFKKDKVEGIDSAVRNAPPREVKCAAAQHFEERGEGSRKDYGSDEEGKRSRHARTQRKLGSLSPTSAEPLLQPLPSASGSADSTSTEGALLADPSVPELDSVPNLASALPMSVLSSQSDLRIASAAVVQRENSPNTSLPSPSKLMDANRTSARRVPIAQAIAQGTFPTLRYGSSTTGGLLRHTDTSTGPGMGLLGSPVFKRPPLDDPMRSPAKRIPISQTMSTNALTSPVKGKAPERGISPVRAFSKDRQRSASVEPRLLASQIERNSSVEPLRPPIPSLAVGKDGLFMRPSSDIGSQLSGSASAGSNTKAGKTRGALPFPITAATSRVPLSIPEAKEDVFEPSSPPAKLFPSSSPSRQSHSKTSSNLRQPSAGSRSRIPRIGAKPYARPKTTESSSSKDLKTSLTASRAGGASVAGTSTDMIGPLRIVRVTTGSGSSSDESTSRHGTPRPRRNLVSRAAASPVIAESSTLHTLKRKREEEKSRTSPPGAQPVVLVRKVVPGILNQPVKARASPAAVATKKEPSPPKVQGRIKIRKVADWKKPQPQPPPVEINRKENKAIESDRPQAQVQSEVIEFAPRITPPSSPIHRHLSLVKQTGASVSHDVQLPLSTSVSESIAPSSGTRRSTRPRRHVEPMADVFGAISTAVRPLKTRPKHVLPRETSAFSGMSALALKALTTANTTKNQQHVAAIHTEVIRKEGKRPDSPTTKVRTIFEQQRELKARERQERAERRAKKVANSNTRGDTVDDLDGFGDVGDLSTVSVDTDGIPLRHRRGPGEEEDYETPQQPERPLKRGRLDEDVDAKDEKRVKWDRGLQTTVYLDDSPPKPRNPTKASAIMKGCLAQTAKTLRLDTLGNVLNADVPLSDLVHENIVVKKFIYDDDDVQSPDDRTGEPQPPTTAPAIKITRSKSKKSKA
ncbi:hypothetical protein AcW2_004654 [Taiwanofungus camphoratus]|nr:hypothetical protein AcW2_004654 [Antrodia cinnamomea]